MKASPSGSGQRVSGHLKMSPRRRRKRRLHRPSATIYAASWPSTVTREVSRTSRLRISHVWFSHDLAIPLAAVAALADRQLAKSHRRLLHGPSHESATHSFGISIVERSR